MVSTRQYHRERNWTGLPEKPTTTIKRSKVNLASRMNIMIPLSLKSIFNIWSLYRKNLLKNPQEQGIIFLICVKIPTPRVMNQGHHSAWNKMFSNKIWTQSAYDTPVFTQSNLTLIEGHRRGEWSSRKTKPVRNLYCIYVWKSVILVEISSEMSLFLLYITYESTTLLIQTNKKISFYCKLKPLY